METIILAVVRALLGTVGQTIIKSKEISADVTKSGNVSAVEVVKSGDDRAKAESADRAGVQKSQGAWGPFGIVAFAIAMPLVYHLWLVVLDSTGWYVVLTLHYYVMPWLEWKHHAPGTWNIKVLPGLFEQTEHAIFTALFYASTAGAAAGGAAVAVVRAFRK